MKSIAGILLFLLLLVSCKSGKLKETKDTDVSIETTNMRLDEKLDASAILEKHLSAEPDFETLHILGSAEYSGFGLSLQSDIRIERGEQILITLKQFGFTGAKIYITPERVSFYTIQKTYYDGDFSVISDLLGVALDYEKVENLLLGKALYDDQQKIADKDIEESLYRVLTQLVTRNDLVELQYWIDAGWNLHKEKLSMGNSYNELEINYKNHQQSEGVILPKEIFILATNQNQSVELKLKYTKINKNTDLNFTYEIPKNAEEIRL